MDEIYVAEAVFRIVRERRSTIVDVLQYGNVKSMEQYGKYRLPKSCGTGTQEPARKTGAIR